MPAQIQPEKSFLCHQVQDPNAASPEFEILLDYLKHSCDCDLTTYKRSSLMRRFQHRMQSLKINTYHSYLQYLQCHPKEYSALLDDVLINVTSFFRDGDSWDYLAAQVIPKILASKQLNEPIRVWSAGCAGGQETYSILILLAETLGLKACCERVQCFATDADAAALLQARQATYNSREMIGIAPELVEKYFEPSEKGYVFHPELHRCVIFARHDLNKDAPLSKIDLLICRNVLIYLNTAAQASILTRFHFALKHTGFLFLGKAEMIINQRQVFTPVSTKHRIYAKRLKLELDDYLSLIPKSRKQQATNLLPIQNYFWEAAFETSAYAHLAIDMNGCLLYANEQAITLFSLKFDDWTRPVQELEEIAQLIDANTLTQALHIRQELTELENVEWVTPKGIKHFDINISRVLSNRNHLLGVTLTFIEINEHKQLQEELELTRLELAKVSQILEETKSELSIAYRDLESSQKELQILT